MFLKYKMGFFQSFNKKEDVKKENTSKLDEMPPPPLPNKGQSDNKDKLNAQTNDIIPPPPQIQKTPSPNKTKKTPDKAMQASPDKNPDLHPSKEAANQTATPLMQKSPQFSQPNLAENKIPRHAQTSEAFSQTKKDEMPITKTTMQTQQNITVPETLPKMPSLNVKYDNKNQSTYTFVPSSTADIPYFSNIEIEEPTDENEDLLNLPVIDIEDDTESYGRFKYRNLKKPLFIRTDHYSQILTNVDTMKNYVEESSDKISMLNNLKRNADIEHKKYKQVLEDIQRKLIYIDRVLFD